MPGEKTGFHVAYASYRAMEADHAAYMTHGALIVRCQPSEAPEPTTAMALRIVSPEGETFDFEAEAGQFLKKKGLMVSFEHSTDARAALDAHVGGEVFGSKTVTEAGDPAPPTVTTFDPSEASDFGEKTPFDGAGSVTPFDLTDPEPEPFEIPPLDEAPPAARRGTQAAPAGGTELRRPDPGSEYPVYVVKYPTVADFAEVIPVFEKTATMPVPFDEEESNVNDVAMLRLVLPGRNQFQQMGVIERIEPGVVHIRVDDNEEIFRKACIYPTTIAARKRLEKELPEHRGPPNVLRILDAAPDEETSKMPLRRRLARMGMDDKINLALSGNREERMAIAMDGNRAVHHYLLKNAKISLDEIAFMARLPSMNPDVLDKIAENPSYTQNPTVTKALVYNPKTPIRTAIRLLDRLPRPEVMNLSKRNNLNLRLVMAAKKKIERFKG